MSIVTTVIFSSSVTEDEQNRLVISCTCGDKAKDNYACLQTAIIQKNSTLIYILVKGGECFFFFLWPELIRTGDSTKCLRFDKTRTAS